MHIFISFPMMWLLIINVNKVGSFGLSLEWFCSDISKQELQILFPLTLYCWVTTICMSVTIVTSLSLEEKLDTHQKGKRWREWSPLFLRSMNFWKPRKKILLDVSGKNPPKKWSAEWVKSSFVAAAVAAFCIRSRRSVSKPRKGLQ